MFDLVRLNLAGQWHTPSLGELAELLVFYDQVEVRAPVARLGELVPRDIDEARFFRELVEQRKITILIDQTPLGEVALEMGLFGDQLGNRVDPNETRLRLREAYRESSPPLTHLVDANAQYARAWVGEWDRIMSMAVNPVTRDADYVDKLIANAEHKLALVSDPNFLSTALAAFATEFGRDTRRMLLDMTTREAEFDGRPVVGFNTKWFATSATMLEFLSQADILLDNIDGQEGIDDFTFPAFDRWTGQLIAGSLTRVGVRDELDAFQTSVLGASTIAAAIDRNARSFLDIKQLLVAREPFAKAVRGRPVDTSLTEAYFEEIQKTSWITQGPGKVVRFSLFSGASILSGALLTPIVGTAVGLGLGLLDSFVVDRLVKGNACRSFVEEGLQPFVDK